MTKKGTVMALRKKAQEFKFLKENLLVKVSEKIAEFYIDQNDGDYENATIVIKQIGFVKIYKEENKLVLVIKRPGFFLSKGLYQKLLSYLKTNLCNEFKTLGIDHFNITEADLDAGDAIVCAVAREKSKYIYGDYLLS